MPPSFWLRRGSASQAHSAENEEAERINRQALAGRRRRVAFAPNHPLVQPMHSHAWRRRRPSQIYAHEAHPVRWRVMHKSPRPAIFTTHEPCTRPPVGRRLRDSFLFVNGFSQVCPARTTSRASSRRPRNELGGANGATGRFRLSTVYPPPGRTYPPLGKLGHHHFHLRHVTGPHGKVTPELLAGMSGKNRISPGRQNVRW